MCRCLCVALILSICVNSSVACVRQLNIQDQDKLVSIAIDWLSFCFCFLFSSFLFSVAHKRRADTNYASTVLIIVAVTHRSWRLIRTLRWRYHHHATLPRQVALRRKVSPKPRPNIRFLRTEWPWWVAQPICVTEWVRKAKRWKIVWPCLVYPPNVP